MVGAGAACSGLLTTCELAGRLMTLLGSTRAFSVEPGHVPRDITEVIHVWSPMRALLWSL